MGKWKGVRLNPGEPIELYDLDKDLGEKTNIASAHADIVRRIDQIMTDARTESSYFPVPNG